MTDAERHAREAVPPRVDPTAAFATPEPAGPELGVAPAPSAPPPTVAPLASVIARPSGSSSRGTSLLLGLAAAIAIGGIAFAGGRLTAPAAAATSGRGTGQFGANGNGQLPSNGQGFAGQADGFGGVTLKGTVTAISADSITFKLASGTSITIPLSSSTTYHAATTSSASAVAVGSEVSVTPGARTANPGASPDANAAPNPAASGVPGFGGLSFGAASDVTVVQP